MRRFVSRTFLVLSIGCALTAVGSGQGQQPTPPAKPASPAAVKPAPFTLTVDNIMKGDKLIGSAPTAVRWAPDSSRIYFSWQKPGEARPSTYSVNRDGADLKPLTPEEVRQIPTAPTGRPDRSRKRLLAAEGGNIVIYDWRRARGGCDEDPGSESSSRWAPERHDGDVCAMATGSHGAQPSARRRPRCRSLTSSPAVTPGCRQRGAAGSGGGARWRSGGAQARVPAGRAGTAGDQQLTVAARPSPGGAES
jgi:hypothetical protein